MDTYTNESAQKRMLFQKSWQRDAKQLDQYTRKMTTMDQK